MDMSDHDIQKELKNKERNH